MILSRKLSDALNEQINMEMWSSNLYLSMSVHFTQIGLDGFAHWTLKQSQEELEHAYKMIDYSIKRGGQVTIGVVNSVPTAWESRWRFSSISTSMRCMYRINRQDCRYRFRRERQGDTRFPMGLRPRAGRGRGYSEKYCRET